MTGRRSGRSVSPAPLEQTYPGRQLRRHIDHPLPDVSRRAAGPGSPPSPSLPPTARCAARTVSPTPTTGFVDGNPASTRIVSTTDSERSTATAGRGTPCAGSIPMMNMSCPLASWMGSAAAGTPDACRCRSSTSHTTTGPTGRPIRSEASRQGGHGIRETHPARPPNDSEERPESCPRSSIRPLCAVAESEQRALQWGAQDRRWRARSGPTFLGRGGPIDARRTVTAPGTNHGASSSSRSGASESAYGAGARFSRRDGWPRTPVSARFPPVSQTRQPRGRWHRRPGPAGRPRSRPLRRRPWRCRPGWRRPPGRAWRGRTAAARRSRSPGSASSRARSGSFVSRTGRPTTMRGAGRPASAAAFVTSGTMCRSTVAGPVIHKMVPSAMEPARWSMRSAMAAR